MTCRNKWPKPEIKERLTKARAGTQRTMFELLLFKGFLEVLSGGDT